MLVRNPGIAAALVGILVLVVAAPDPAYAAKGAPTSPPAPCDGRTYDCLGCSKVSFNKFCIVGDSEGGGTRTACTCANSCGGGLSCGLCCDRRFKETTRELHDDDGKTSLNDGAVAKAHLETCGVNCAHNFAR